MLLCAACKTYSLQELGGIGQDVPGMPGPEYQCTNPDCELVKRQIPHPVCPECGSLDLDIWFEGTAGWKCKTCRYE